MIEDLTVLTRTAKQADLSLRYGDAGEQVADLRYGRRGGELPLLVLIHGGFWKPQYDRAHLEAMSSALAEAGWTTLTLEYRRVPGRPEFTFQDIAAAITLLPQQVVAHNGKYLLIGHSAGGHLALWAAVQCEQSALQGVLALAPAANLQLSYQLKLGAGAVLSFLGKKPAECPNADPVKLKAPTMAVSVLQGKNDEIVPPAVAASYVAAFPKTRYVVLPGCGHFALIDPQSGAWSTVIKELVYLSGA
jgi:acetyl esterase/lipase